jgi:hypothetical protein
MRQAHSAVVTRILEQEFRDLPLRPTPEPARPTPAPSRRTSDRIRDALLRWLEQEM